ncbi:MAG: hypothetical protein Greene041679_464 [Parcubacteria group bacterium Greene0416_79]|nr:MAG: hypothetical protein Greene041679_464 [Parcubacteria group bacterium Greene0416_79]
MNAQQTQNPGGTATGSGTTGSTNAQIAPPLSLERVVLILLSVVATLILITIEIRMAADISGFLTSTYNEQLGVLRAPIFLLMFIPTIAGMSAGIAWLVGKRTASKWISDFVFHRRKLGVVAVITLAFAVWNAIVISVHLQGFPATIREMLGKYSLPIALLIVATILYRLNAVPQAHGGQSAG